MYKAIRKNAFLLLPLLLLASLLVDRVRQVSATSPGTVNGATCEPAVGCADCFVQPTVGFFGLTSCDALQCAVSTLTYQMCKVGAGGPCPIDRTDITNPCSGCTKWACGPVSMRTCGGCACGGPGGTLIGASGDVNTCT